jgi:predicted ATPase
MKIETIEIRNYKVFQNVKIDNIGSIEVFLGENGTGKTTLFDVFGFMKACLTENVRSALQARGGYSEVHSRAPQPSPQGEGSPLDAEGNISFVIEYKMTPNQPLFIYELHIGLNGKNEPSIGYEALYSNEFGGKRFVFVRKGEFVTFTKKQEDGLKMVTGDAPPNFKMADGVVLGLSIIGQMEEYQDAVILRKYIENWFISDFQINKMRLTQDVSYNESLNRKGDNIANVAQYLYDRYPDRFTAILKKMQERIPGVTKVEAKTTEEGGILLRFQDGRFKDAFASRYVSDGTIKMFAYLVMLADPNPHKLLCIEEPENQLYPQLLEILAEEFREYVAQDGQVFISTHSPDLVNALEPQELFLIKKQENGYSAIRSIAENRQVVDLFDAGDKLGSLWKQGLLDYWPE